MIINSFLIILQGVVNILLAPLVPLNWTITTAFSINVISDFINIVAFILPWSNLSHIIVFIIAMFAFRIIISLIKTIWELLPIL